MCLFISGDELLSQELFKSDLQIIPGVSFTEHILHDKWRKNAKMFILFLLLEWGLGDFFWDIFKFQFGFPVF